MSEAPTEPIPLPLRAAPARDWALVVLAFGLALAVNIMAVGILLDAFENNEQLSDNAAQVLSTVFGGMIGILGSALGYRAGKAASSE